MFNANEFRFGPFLVDTRRQKIIRDGQPLRGWSRRRYALLKVLIEANGAPLTYDFLIETVWNQKDVTIHTVVKTVNDLKRNLGEHGACIHNLPGIGYYFQSPPHTSGVQTADLDLDSLTRHALAQEEFARRTRESLKVSLDNFRYVNGRYPGFVDAHLGRAECLILLAHMGFQEFAPREVMPELRSAIQTSLDLAHDARTRAAAFAALAKYQLLFEWKFEESEQNFQKALALDSQSAAIYHGLAHVFLVKNRWDESDGAITQARRMAPSSPMIHGTVGWLRFFMKRYAEAIEHCRQTTTLHPRFPAGYVMLGVAYEAGGRFSEAKSAFESSYDLEPAPVPVACLGHLYGHMGERAPAEECLLRLNEMKRNRFVSSYCYALIHTGLGEFEMALESLREAVAEPCDWMIYLGLDPRWEPLRAFADFSSLLSLVGVI